MAERAKATRKAASNAPTAATGQQAAGAAAKGAARTRSAAGKTPAGTAAQGAAKAPAVTGGGRSSGMAGARGSGSVSNAVEAAEKPTTEAVTKKAVKKAVTKPPVTAAKEVGATMAKSADSKMPATRGGTARGAGGATATRKGAAATVKQSRTAAETEKIRGALAARHGELREEYEQHLAEIAELQRDRLTDSAGDDQADTGSKTFEREQEISLANSILERITQVERALERLDEGSYGWCERCGNPIPVERLAAFPSATLCITCKQLEERR